MRLASLTLAASLLALPACAESHSAMNHDSMDHSKMDNGTMNHSGMEGVHTAATINSIDGDTYNVTHPPIPALKWPAMTMDLTLIEGAEVGDVSPGDKVMLMIAEGADGLYGLQAVMPAE